MEDLQLPAPGQIHVWQHPLSSSEGDRESLWALLSPDERERAARFHFATHRDAFIASHAWLRTLLGGYLQADPCSIEFILGKHGKPAIDGTPIHFNLSHSGAVAACAVTKDHEVGIDIERIRPMPGLESIARRSFHPEEYRQILALHEDERASAFFRCWTRKEAYVKAVGAGLIHDESPGADWSLIDLDAGPDFACALAIRSNNWTVLSRHG